MSLCVCVLSDVNHSYRDSVRLASAMSLQGLNIGFAKLTSKWAQGSHSTLSSCLMPQASTLLNRTLWISLTCLWTCESRARSLDTSFQVHIATDQFHITIRDCGSWIPTCSTGFTKLFAWLFFRGSCMTMVHSSPCGHNKHTISCWSKDARFWFFGCMFLTCAERSLPCNV